MTPHLIQDLAKRIQEQRLFDSYVLEWAMPVSHFGNLNKSNIATLGLNPSDKEFLDNNGIELSGRNRRFHTFKSLELESWNQIDDFHTDKIFTACEDYFLRNPYDAWFKKLDKVISATGQSYYHPLTPACHLDLVPYATSKKWGDISNTQKSKLLQKSGDALGFIVRNSQLQCLVLNGRNVIDNFKKITDVNFEINQKEYWSLPRKAGDISGYSFRGYVSKIHDVNLGRKIMILGYNHNIQSSFGVTNIVQNAICEWVGHQYEEFIK